jgi:hypothetical protein
MPEPFGPEINPSPDSLKPTEILARLPEHYLKSPTASNYVGLGIIYTLMGLATPEELESDAYIDKVLTGVFTALNEKAATLGYPAFYPPTTLEHPASTRIARMIDAEINGTEQQQSEVSDITDGKYKYLFNYLFGKYPIFHSAGVKTAGIVSKAIDHIRETTGKDFPVSAELGGTWDYDAQVHRRLIDFGILDADVKAEFIAWLLAYKLQPSSNWVEKCDETKGHLGANFVKFLPRFISDFVQKVNTRREVQPLLLEGSETETDNGGVSDTDEDSVLDRKLILDSFRGHIEANSDKYHEDGPSLLEIIDLLLKDYRPREIREELGMTPRDYSSRYARIFAAGKDFQKMHPEFRATIQAMTN